VVVAVIVIAAVGLLLVMSVIKLFKKNGAFWDVTPCGSCKNRRFEEHSAS
jgi:hypothetical protein